MFRSVATARFLALGCRFRSDLLSFCDSDFLSPSSSSSSSLFRADFLDCFVLATFALASILGERRERNMGEHIRMAVLLFPKVTQLDFTGPMEVISRMDQVEINYVAKTLDPIMTDCGFGVVPTKTIEDFQQPGSIDLLFIPGGAGIMDVMEDPTLIAWVKMIGNSSKWITSVCTGAFVLAAAGLLRGYKATTHWAWVDFLKPFGAEYVKERVVIDRNRITGGGVTSGIDFAFFLVSKLRNEETAKFISLYIEYDPSVAYRSTPDTAEPKLLERVSQMGEQRRKRMHSIVDTLCSV